MADQGIDVCLQFVYAGVDGIVHLFDLVLLCPAFLTALSRTGGISHAEYLFLLVIREIDPADWCVGGHFLFVVVVQWLRKGSGRCVLLKLWFDEGFDYVFDVVRGLYCWWPVVVSFPIRHSREGVLNDSLLLDDLLLEGGVGALGNIHDAPFSQSLGLELARPDTG